MSEQAYICTLCGCEVDGGAADDHAERCEALNELLVERDREILRRRDLEARLNRLADEYEQSVDGLLDQLEQNAQLASLETERARDAESLHEVADRYATGEIAALALVAVVGDTERGDWSQTRFVNVGPTDFQAECGLVHGLRALEFELIATAGMTVFGDGFGEVLDQADELEREQEKQNAEKITPLRPVTDGDDD